ncbi:MAG: ferrous iron transport protein B [Actinobacteria bacterium HGW-Actinobacteria-1]|jgi:ferrous iron transport protein B|nr:MAG: ferrous iron transport protein B [Actinobacteria bacterium HGW-Actinobacteria-1]
MATCHTPTPTRANAPASSTASTVVLAGNPNVGKSVVFAALTGTYVDVSNFPGTTVEVFRGRRGDLEIIDTPGVYGVGSLNDEEAVARDVILTADTVVNVVDAVHPERDLFLTLQLIDMGLPVIVALNMADEARKQGVAIDRDLLEDLLGVPVVETVAVTGVGIDELLERLPEARPGHADPALDADVLPLAARIGSRAEAILVLEGDAIVAERNGVEAHASADCVYTARRARVNDIVGHVLTTTTEGAGLGAHLSYLMMHPLTGLPMLGALLWLMYKVLGEWVASDLVGFTEGTIMNGYYEPFMRGLVSHVFAAGSAGYTFLAGEFGVVTMTVTYLLGVILPLVAGFYLLMALLEDSGYLPRIAALADRSLTSLGLNGRAVIPLILGLGCVTMGTLTTRILGSKRERFIATALMAIAVPCSAQIAVISALMARVGGWYALGYFAALLAIFVAVGTVLNKLTPGVSTDLLIDLPPLRVPRIGNVLRKSSTKVYHFMKEVAVFFLAGAALISVLDITGALTWVQTVAQPLTVGWLHLPKEAATAFVMGFVRRDFGAAGFFTMNLSSAQLLVAMVTITLFVPCIASVMVILKERGWKYLAGLLVTSVSGAFLVGGLLTRLLEVLR